MHRVVARGVPMTFKVYDFLTYGTLAYARLYHDPH